ncbi:uncharacterized protein LOC111889075 [Lactuca sativa]|uniref:uncharacterized protein LOC111889075 n=1 Tax=Lactuca sativa TaxID=4236 RepID=UPI000CD93036|nr:uncharacterized protein LOC111889075 [Lactuca sativa]
MGDPGSITIRCLFGDLIITCALADSGDSINVFPYSFFKKLNILKLEPTQMTVCLADKTIIHPRGVCKDILIKVDKLVFPVDFVVLDMEEDHKVPIILGRPFLNTACAIVDVRESELTLRAGDDSVTFMVDQEKKQVKSIEDKTFSMDLDEEMLEKELALCYANNPNQFTLSLEEDFDTERDLKELEKLLKGSEANEEL